MSGVPRLEIFEGFPDCADWRGFDVGGGVGFLGWDGGFGWLSSAGGLAGLDAPAAAARHLAGRRVHCVA